MQDFVWVSGAIAVGIDLFGWYGADSCGYVTAEPLFTAGKIEDITPSAEVTAEILFPAKIDSRDVYYTCKDFLVAWNLMA